jgi:hypothetical protein
MTSGHRVAQITLVIAIAFALTGCARQPPAALPMGPDTFRITASAHQVVGGGMPAAERSALEGALAKCSSIGRELLVTNTAMGFDRPMYRFTATFRCLEKGDPQLVRPIYEKSPDVLIEDRRR